MKAKKVEAALVRAAGRYMTGGLFSTDDDGDFKACNTDMCAQGALWLGMKPRDETVKDWIDGLDGTLGQDELTQVEKHYGLNPMAVEVIPSINDKQKSDQNNRIIPEQVYAWLEFTHENPRMRVAMEIINDMNKKGLGDLPEEVEDRTSKTSQLLDQLGRIDPRLKKWVKAMFHNDSSDTEVLAEEAGLEMVLAAASGEKKAKTPLLNLLAKHKLMSRKLRRKFHAQRPGPGWKRGFACVVKKLEPKIRENIAKVKEMRAKSS